MSDHDFWEELAAGHALSALEPAEEAELAVHLETCARCRQAVADHSFVAAQLGSLVDTSDAPSWAQIRGGVLPPREVVPLDRARRRRTPILLSAAASLALLAGGAAVLLDSGTSGTPKTSALSACRADSACQVVQLADRATLLVQDGAVKVLPTHLGPAPAGKVYVLWQLPRAGRPTMVAVLPMTSNGGTGETHALALPFASTAAFGLSLEPSDSVPVQPTDVLAVGTA